ncbi:putative transcriptional regulator [Galbibacter orientalis DSM 19592]|uniref:Putative transcriptional regulator n=1 Tax=Galbibacter orientalis DSM 19592 TaxID=926559 RepID=I3C588_9FLAO|nr:helix-turn-helix transcriptional regulator [Galbibacter orientalis]EIJ38781.1 putative transcriptional regulator [Galbibacter orientalis DSM 19592]
MSTATKPNHIGRKISRIRELRGMKQEALAMELGISQQSVSLIEQSETIEDEKLEQVAKVLGVTSEAIKNFSEESVLNIMSNTFHDNSVLNGVLYNPTFNPIDKIMELVDENKKLYQELLKAEKDKISYLEKLLNKK